MTLSTFRFTDNPPTGQGRAVQCAQRLLSWALQFPSVLFEFEAADVDSGLGLDSEPSDATKDAVRGFVAALHEANEVGAGRLLSADLRAELEVLARRCAPIARELGIEDA